MSDYPDIDNNLGEAESDAKETATSAVERKLEHSKACTWGFILSLFAVVSVIVSGISFHLELVSIRNNPGVPPYGNAYFSPGSVGFFGTLVSIVLCIAAFVVSTVGLVVSVKKARKGKRLGLAGIIISSLLGIVFIFISLGMRFMLSLNTNVANPQIYNGIYGSTGVYEYKYDKDKTGATVLTWYWDGNTLNSVIDIPEKTPEEVKITGFGEEGSLFPPEFRIKIKDSNKDYYQTERFKKSEAFRAGWVPTEYTYEDFGIPMETEVKFEDLAFTIVVDKDIKIINVVNNTAQANTLAYINDDGSITFYSILYSFECDPDNDVYYSKEGKLYFKSNDNPVFINLPYKTE